MQNLNLNIKNISRYFSTNGHRIIVVIEWFLVLEKAGKHQSESDDTSQPWARLEKFPPDIRPR